MRRIVDTNVLIAANGQAEQASPNCVISCVDAIQQLTSGGQVVVDDNWLILREYGRRLHSSGQPGVGDAFYKWILTNQGNPNRCELVHITPINDSQTSFKEFPTDSRLNSFDPADRKFIATSLAHSSHPPICQALDRKWHQYEDVLLEHGVEIDFLC